MLLVTIVISITFFAGCAKPCFYQAVKSLEQCKHDLHLCIDQALGTNKSQSDQLTRSCMQAKGYECLDSNKVSQNTKRIVVIAPFETYGVLDGLGAAPAHSMAKTEQNDLNNPVEPGAASDRSATVVQEKPQESIAEETPTAKKLGYRARMDANGKYIITPVYGNDLKKEADSPQ
jgi:hypothetical protein